MVSTLLVGLCLMAACVAIHGSGVTAAIYRLAPESPGAPVLRRWVQFSLLAGWMILLHLVEVTVWASFYLWLGAMPDLDSGLYFSAVTYTTTGYGDLVLPVEWRLLGAVEALTGILMCGWSTGFFFAVVSRMFDSAPSVP